MNDVYSLVRQAIIDKDQVVGTYRGHIREMCPHVIGTKDGVRRALFYQFGGTSQRTLWPDGSTKNWRCIPIDRLRDVSVRKGPWHTAPIHSRRQACIDYIDVQAN